MNIDDAALADSLRRLSQPREDDGSITSALQVVVAACVDLFGVDGAGVLIADEQDILVYAAASDGPGRLLEQTEAEAGEGPCTEAFVQGRVVTSRDVTKRERSLQLGADQAYESGARLPERVDAVMETVGEPTWDHSVKSLTQGGTLVVTGATGGHRAVTDLRQIFFLQKRIIGSTMGTRDELSRLMRLMAETGLRPVVDSVLPLEEAATAFQRLASGDVFGKIVLTRPA